MATKQEFLAHLKLEKKYHKDYGKYLVAKEKWIKKLKPGDVSTADAGPGSNPPTPPPPPPPFP